jgi:DNA-binding transcriptional MerR regulator
MPRHYTIGELARGAGVPTSTVRYYERRRLLRPGGRSSGNYRLYDEAALERLRFIRSAQAAGFTLTDIAALVHFRDGDAAPCREVQELIKTRLAHVRQELGHLREVEGLLQKWLRACRAAGRSGSCAVLEGLAGLQQGSCKNPENSS